MKCSIDNAINEFASEKYSDSSAKLRSVQWRAIKYRITVSFYKKYKITMTIEYHTHCNLNQSVPEFHQLLIQDAADNISLEEQVANGFIRVADVRGLSVHEVIFPK